MSWTAFSSSYSVERNGCSARSLSVEYCWWGRRKVLLTFSIEIAGVAPRRDGHRLSGGRWVGGCGRGQGLVNASNRLPGGCPRDCLHPSNTPMFRKLRQGFRLYALNSQVKRKCAVGAKIIAPNKMGLSSLSLLPRDFATHQGKRTEAGTSPDQSCGPS